MEKLIGLSFLLKIYSTYLETAKENSVTVAHHISSH